MTDHFNSNTDLGFICIEELMMVAEEIRSIFLDTEFQWDETPEKVRKVVKFMPVMYICNKHKSVFINLHEFVYAPEVFELFLPSEDLDLDQDKDDTDKEEMIWNHSPKIKVNMYYNDFP